jgi:hypothetical protein
MITRAPLAHRAVEHIQHRVRSGTAWTRTSNARYSARVMREPFEAREHWRDVSIDAFEAFLRDYPRPLEARPPLSRKARYREWTDATLGRWPGNAVAKTWTRGRSMGYQIRDASRDLDHNQPF